MSSTPISFTDSLTDSFTDSTTYPFSVINKNNNKSFKTNKEATVP